MLRFQLIFFFLIINYCMVIASWNFEFHGGTVWNVPSRLHIVQKGYPDIDLVARWRGEPFILPVYWDWRISRWQNNRSWELESIHNKMFLDNPTDDIQGFSISHGFNIFTINRGFKKNGFVFRPGLGIVVAHPENNIRHQKLDESYGIFDNGYQITGPSAILSIARPLNISSRLFLNPEAKTTFGFSRVKIHQGYADVYNFALHLILGFGFTIIK